MARRTVAPDSEVLNKRRTLAGLTIQELAERADISPRSAQAACNNGPVGVEILRSIADVLTSCGQATTYEEMLRDRTAVKRLAVTIVIEVEMTDEEAMKASADLVERLVMHLPAASEIVIRQVKSGSVLLVLDMIEEDLLRFIELLPRLKESLDPGYHRPLPPGAVPPRPAGRVRNTTPYPPPSPLPPLVSLIRGIKEVRIEVE